jgi:hypothetical protein
VTARNLSRTALRTALATLAATALAGSAAQAAVPFKEIASSAGPLTSVALGDELSCQVAYRGDARFELFPSAAKPGDCGTFVFTAGTLFAPNFSAHDSTATSSLDVTTPWTPVSQTAVTGTGTAANPFKVTTVADAGASGVRITQSDTYVTGQESYRTDTTVQNTGGAAATGILYRAGDCYLQESDTGFGFLDAAQGAVGCSINANNAPAGRIEQWYPITTANQYIEGRYSEVWGAIATHAPLPNTTRAAESIDNGAAISWSFSVEPGGQQTYSHYTTFSPTGVTGPPPATTTVPTPSIAFGPNGLLSTPTNLRCVSKRYFPIRLRKKFWPNIAAVTVKMPRTTRVLRRKPWGTNVDLRGLPKGTFFVRITALTVTGKTIRGTRTYRTCRGRLRGGIPPL